MKVDSDISNRVYPIIKGFLLQQCSLSRISANQNTARYITGSNAVCIYAAFLCIVFVLLAQKITLNRKLYLNYFFLILCANLILWTKNEGMFFLSFLSFFIIFKKEIPKNFKLILIIIFIALILIKQNIYLHYFENPFIGWEGYQFLKINELFTYCIRRYHLKCKFCFYLNGIIRFKRICNCIHSICCSPLIKQLYFWRYFKTNIIS